MFSIFSPGVHLRSVHLVFLDAAKNSSLLIFLLNLTIIGFGLPIVLLLALNKQSTSVGDMEKSIYSEIFCRMLGKFSFCFSGRPRISKLFNLICYSRMSALLFRFGTSFLRETSSCVSFSMINDHCRMIQINTTFSEYFNFILNISIFCTL